MKSNDIAIPNIPEVKTISPSSSPKDRVINTIPEDRASSSSDSSGSSLSDLRRRLQDLPSPNEFTLLADRVAALGRRICRKREVFLHLHGVASRIEENDEEERDGSESSSRAFRPKDARARRRVRIGSSEGSFRDDEAMVIPRAIGAAKITGSDETPNFGGSSVNRSAQGTDCLRLPAIEVPRRQPSSEPSTTRNDESRDVTRDACFYSDRNFTSRERSADLPSVAPFAFSKYLRPKKFGGYRPSSGVLLKNLSSGSESESTNSASCQLSSGRRIGAIATLEMSSPEMSSAIAAARISEPTKKMPIMSARSDITRSILPNLLPSTRSLHDDEFGCEIYRGDRVKDALINCHGFCDEPKRLTNVSARTACHEPINRDELLARTSGEYRYIEDTRDEKREILQDILASCAKSFTSRSANLTATTDNERIDYDRSVTKISNELKQAKSEYEDKLEEEEEGTESDRSATFKVCRSVEDHRVAGKDVHDRTTSFCARESADTHHLTGGVQNDATEEALSSQTSEPLESESYSQSSCTPKIHFPKEALLSRSPQIDVDISDKYEQEAMTMASVPTLALNSQDISYSTSANSRECSATRPLDPRVLIQALSDVSLKQAREGKNVSRQREDPYRPGQDTIGVSSTSDFLLKAETWRVPRSLTSKSSDKSLSRIPSRIPIRIADSRIISPIGNLGRITDYQRAKFTKQNFIHTEVASGIIQQEPKTNSSHAENYKQNSFLRSNENIKIAKTHPAAFESENDMAEYQVEDYEPRYLSSSNLRNPQTSPLGDHTIYRKPRPKDKFNRRNYPTAPFDKAIYSSDRGSKIDVRSRSDYDTSRKTVEVTDASGSLCLPMYRNNDLILENRSSRVETSRIAGENITWRTENEDASINDEENPVGAKDKDYYGSDDDKEDLYLPEKECFEPAIERIVSSPLKAHPFQIRSSSEIERVAGKQRVSYDPEFHGKSEFDRSLESTKVAQSENLMLQVRRMQEVCSFAARKSSSTLNLNCEQRRKKKSQERFPFTISEAPAALSTKHEDTTDYQLPDKDFRRTKAGGQLEEKTEYQLKVHPSIMRLASEGLEDTMAEILCYVAQDQKEIESSSRSRIKGFMRIFSSKLRRTSKRRNDVKAVEPAKVIYENRACQVNSRANSYSGGSSTEEIDKINLDESSKSRWMDRHIARSKPMLISDGNILKKTESLAAISIDHPRRRYEHDDLWMQDFKETSFEIEEDSETSKQDQVNRSKTSSSKDPCLIFLEKNFQSDKLLEAHTDHGNFLKERQSDALISGYAIPSVGKNKKVLEEKSNANFLSEVEEIEKDLTGCLCLRLCRLIALSKYNLSIRKQVPPSRMKRSLQKRKE